MENASKALLIAGAILLCILIIAIGMFIYNSAQSTVVDSLTNLSTQEIEACNSQFMAYQGVQKGTYVKSLINSLISNASTYIDEPTKIPAISWKSDAGVASFFYVANRDAGDKSAIQTYIDKVSNLSIKKNREYYVLFSYQTNGLIDVISILNKLDYSPEEALKRASEGHSTR